MPEASEYKVMQPELHHQDQLRSAILKAADKGEPLLVLWNHSVSSLSSVPCLALSHRDGEAPAIMASLGLTSRPTLLLLRPDGQEFGRIDHLNVSPPVDVLAQSLLELYRRENEIQERYSLTIHCCEDCAEALDLFIVQRRLSASLNCYQKMADDKAEVSSLLARRLGELAVNQGRFLAAKPFFQMILDSTASEIERLEAWSRLIWCCLTLGETEEARRLSEGFMPRESHVS